MQEPTEKPLKVLNAILVYQVHLRSLDYLCRSQYLPVVDEPSMGSRCEMSKGFDWLSKYARITRNMNQDHFMFFILYLCDLHNRKLLLLK